ncbi:hypothetical protein JOD54_000822 [Actinokineospora baliensis]|uniref:deoxynucleotide monophosphate kinase family protein n=1 Tax=Actinokineospora baliensis TaxID=547056 RepID=UPI00195EA7B4|nr:hypothetical protein [Actinokineospora baliensis]MBM7770618.1 hypothetical protein [Actinokineospora baliensis]
MHTNPAEPAAGHAMRPVGIVGRKRSGKDTVAAQLVAAHGYTRVAFGDPVKALAEAVNPIIVGPADLLGRPGERLRAVLDRHGWDQVKEDLPRARDLLQTLGTGVRDLIDPHAWIDAWARHAETVPGPLVVPDVRFPNEAEHLRSLGFVLIRVSRPGLPSTDTHVSETGSDLIATDHHLINGGTLADLSAAVETLTEEQLTCSTTSAGTRP